MPNVPLALEIQAQAAIENIATDRATPMTVPILIGALDDVPCSHA